MSAVEPHGSRSVATLTHDAASRASRGASGSRRGPWDRRVRVLVAEDHDDTREALRLLLELEGYDVYTARNGKEALEAALEVRPDVVITDFDMPEMDGASLSRALRAHAGRLGKVPILVLTALGWSLIQRAMEAGADLHIPKPVDFHVLGETLEQVVEGLNLPAESDGETCPAA